MAALGASSLRADWRLFLPRSFSTGASVDLFGSSERDEIRNTERPSSWNDEFLKAKLTLFSEGYFYHPRFLLYRASIGGALKRELYEESGSPPAVWQRASGLEYDTQITLLPEHAYNLTIFARRFEPMVRERSATLIDSLDTSYGALVRYRKRPLFASAGYNDDTLESGGLETRIRKLDLSGQYYKELRSGFKLSLSGSFAPARYDNNRGSAGETTEGSLVNVLERNGTHLTSNLSRSTFDQKGDASGDFGATQLVWREHFTANLKRGFRTRLEYRATRSESHLPAGSPERTLTSRGSEAEAALLHQLFQSLESGYVVRYNSQDSTSGRSDLLSHELSENYTKAIPGGRIQASLGVGTSTAENRGRANVISEGHQAVPVPGSFRLVQVNVSPETLVLFLRSPLPPYEAIQLAENVHYTLLPIGNALEIRVLALPPQFVVPGSYTFEVTYSLLSGQFRMRTDTLTHGVSVDLFSNRIVPYYSFVRTSSRVLEGVLPGFLPDSTSLTTGVRSLFGPIRARVQYQDVQWDGSPFTAWDAELQYVGPIGETASLYATAAFTRRNFERTPEAHAGRAFREEIESATANFQKQFFSRTLSLAAGGGYTRIRGLVDTRGVSWSATIAWNVGKLSVSAGASSYLSETVGLALGAPSRLHRYYYLRVNRRLF